MKLPHGFKPEHVTMSPTDDDRRRSRTSKSLPVQLRQADWTFDKVEQAMGGCMMLGSRQADFHDGYRPCR